MDTASNLAFELVFIRTQSLPISLHHCVRGYIQTVPYICRWELLCEDDLMIIAESMSIKELLVKFKTLKSEMAKKG